MHLYITNFSIRVFSSSLDSPLFTIDKGEELLSLKSDTSLLNPNATVILADPFLFVKDDVLFLFYEHLDKWFGTGRICMRSTRDLKTWTDEVDVLVEPFHLSFPYVFEDHGKVYMLPETGGDKSISLYEAEDDTLTKWKLVKRIMEDEEPWYDSVIYKRNGTYYLFTGHDNDIQQVQHLFVADNLMGPYKEHPKSPIYTGRDGGRNAGSIIEYEGHMYRPVQVCMNGYGEQTSVMEIETLTHTEYKETILKKDIIDTTIPPYKEGGHQWNSVEFKGKRIVATDYREKNHNLVELFRMAKRKFFK